MKMLIVGYGQRFSMKKKVLNTSHALSVLNRQHNYAYIINTERVTHDEKLAQKLQY
jgi:hypothetical protein